MPCLVRRVRVNALSLALKQPLATVASGSTGSGGIRSRQEIPIPTPAITFEALKAGYGDCLLVEWSARWGAKHCAC